MSQQTHNQAPHAPGLTLSKEEVDRLLNDSSSDARVDMTHRIGGNYNIKEGLSKQESQAAEQIFRLLLRDAELRVRTSLAGYVKDSTQIPHDIVKKMAQDVEEVSLPILEFSEVLTDEDLVELIESTQQVSRYLAISKRSSVSTVVSEVLIDKGNEQVTESLVGNNGATISDSAYEKIIEIHKGNDEVMKTLTQRNHLPVKIVDKLVTVVSSNLADTLKKKYKMPGQQIEQEVEKAREKETLHLVRMAISDKDIDQLIQQLYSFKRLTPSIILSGLCQGNFDFFEAALAKLSGVPLTNTRKLIHDRGDLGFRAIYNKSGLPEAMFSAVKLLLRVVRDVAGEGEQPGSTVFANRVVEQILHKAEKEPMDNLSYIVALVRKVAQ